MFRLFYFFILIAVVTSSTLATTTWFKGHRFETYVLSDLGYRYPEQTRHSKTHIKVEKDEEYSLVVNNPLPVKVAVAVTIDGLNVIDGKRTTPGKAAKWIIEPYGSLTLRGWQTDQSSLRRFVFTDKQESYAEWKGNRDRKNYTRNLGVIGVAYFWSRRELNLALNPPQPFYPGKRQRQSAKKARRSPASRAESTCKEADDIAGTGMGHRETNHVVDVAFRYDTGMYQSKDILTINYTFARNHHYPQPFKDDCRFGRYAPEMP